MNKLKNKINLFFLLFNQRSRLDEFVVDERLLLEVAC